MQPLSSHALDQLFHHAHSHLAYLPTAIDDATLVRLYETLRWGPTAANSSPLRVTFVRSAEAKARLSPCLAPGNLKKVENAPVTAILAMDLRFFDALPRLFPQVDAKAWYEGKPDVIVENALRNSSLQGGYFVLAARALGLGCGPMSGFDPDAVRKAFFEGTELRPNFLCTLGYPDPQAPRRRNPRLEFSEACRIL
ncbi:MAG: malonic semialdehyde reductase [Planctomycetes bacterium]|nr:malonic semialdehyde reductase [Planctomycetota bacterium]